MSQLSRKSRRGFWILLFALYLTMGLAVEGAAYFYFRLTQPYETLGEYLTKHPRHEYDPHRIVRLNPNHDHKGVRHNRQGFRRSTDVAKEKPPGTIRIFLMGGSAAYGLHAPSPFPDFWVPNEETLDAHLERLLNERFRPIRFEVINAAVMAYRVHIHWIYLNQVLLEYDPDLILFMDGHNDFYRVFKGVRQWTYAFWHPVRVHEPSFSNAVRQVFLFASQYSYALYGVYSRIVKPLLQRRSVKWLMARSWADELTHLDDDLLNRYRETAQKNWAPILRQNARLLQDHGIKGVFMLQPELLLEQSKPFSAVEEHLREMEKSFRPEGHEQYITFLKPLTIEIIRESIEGTGATFIDLTDPFGGMKDQAYIDYCHLSGAGFRHLAHYLLPRLQPIIQDIIANRGLRTTDVASSDERNTL